MKFFVGLIQLLVGLGIVTVTIPAVMAVLGFAVPLFDLLNHLQLLIFSATVVMLILSLAAFGPRRVMTWIALAGFVASAAIFVPEWAYSLAPRPALPTDERPVLKLMTHNVFGLNYDMKRVNATILAEDPDILALQEYFPEQAGGLHDLLIKRYPYFVRCQGGKRANLGLYSKIPFDKEMSDKDCPDSAYGTQRTAHILAGFRLADGTHFSVLTTHMDWPYPIERQQSELGILEAAIAEVKGPLLVVGDFNSTPWSYSMKGFERTTGLTRQTRNLVTYPELFTLRQLIHTIPFLPLDQVFERGVDVHELHRGAETGSDHLPVVFTFSIPASGT